MKEVWTGTYAHRPFRVVVKFGKIVKVEGDLAWAKGLRIRHFKRTVWKAFGNVEREPDEVRTIEVPPPMATPGEKGPETKSEEALQVEDTDGGGLERPVRRNSAPMRELPDARKQRSSVSRVRRRPRVTSGMSLRRALRAAKVMGCDVRHVWRTGETRVSHPELTHEDGSRRTVLLNRRKKDAPRALTVFLTQLQSAITS